MGVSDVDEMDQETYRQAAIDVIQKLADDVGIPKSLSEAGVKREDIPFLAESAFNDACTPGKGGRPGQGQGPCQAGHHPRGHTRHGH